MHSITVSVQDQTYRDICAWCAARDTSISHLVQTFLDDLPDLSYAGRFPLPHPRMARAGSRPLASLYHRGATPPPLTKTVELWERARRRAKSSS